MTPVGERCTIERMCSGSTQRSLLAVGGLDPSGGAGILVDARAGWSLGLHVAGVAAVVTVQDGRSFGGMRALAADDVADAVRAVLRAQDVGAVKTGALGSAENVHALAAIAAEEGFPPLVVDPVLRSSTGGALLDDEGLAALREELFPLAVLITPNAHEAAALTGRTVTDTAGARAAAEQLVEQGARAVLVKGGHLPGERVVDLLVRPEESCRRFENPRLTRGDVRGTGCALATLVAARLALGAGLVDAVEQAREGLRRALESAVAVGSGPRVLGLGR